MMRLGLAVESEDFNVDVCKLTGTTLTFANSFIESKPGPPAVRYSVRDNVPGSG